MNKTKTSEIQLFDVVAVTTPIPHHNLWQGEIGAVVECYPNGGYEVEFVARDGYTYALLTLNIDQLIPLRQKNRHSDTKLQPFTFA